MTVSQLIEDLKKFPPNGCVHVEYWVWTGLEVKGYEHDDGDDVILCSFPEGRDIPQACNSTIKGVRSGQ